MIYFGTKLKIMLILVIMLFLFLPILNEPKIFRRNNFFLGFAVAASGGDTPLMLNTTVFPSNGTIRYPLALVYNQDNLTYDKEYTKHYLNLRNNFSDLKFQRLSANTNFTLSMGNKVDDLRSFRINQSNFVVHLVYCDEFAKFCKFRINGVPTTKMYVPELVGEGKSNSFVFDKDYIIKINNARFNQCDNHRFCHLGYEGYDSVDLSVEKVK